MKGRLHDEKSKCRKVMYDEQLKCKRLENEIQKLNSLEETNNDLRDKLKEALSKKSRATRLTAKAKKLASHRLEKWHIESERRCSAEDEVAHLNKSAMQMNKIIEEYRMVIEQSQKSKCCLKKEWANDEAAAALVLSPAGIDTSKLGDGGVIMTDTCNTAQKVRRILVDRIAGTYELDLHESLAKCMVWEC